MALSAEHIILTELARGAARELLTTLGFVAPAAGLRDVGADLSVAVSMERRADLVLLRDQPSPLVIIVEVQRRWDEGKLYSWPYYVASARTRYRCPAMCLVITPSPTLERRLGRPIDLGGGNTFRPTVLGPVSSREMRVDDSNDQLLILRALVGASIDDGTLTLPAVSAFRGMDSRERSFYIEVLSKRLDKEVRLALENAMLNIPPGYRAIMPLVRHAEERGIEIGVKLGEERGEQRGRREALLDLASKLFAPEVVTELAKVEDVAELSARVQTLLGGGGQPPKAREVAGGT